MGGKGLVGLWDGCAKGVAGRRAGPGGAAAGAHAPAGRQGCRRTSTPSLAMVATSSAMLSSTAGSMPKPCLPSSASPLTLSSTRLRARHGSQHAGGGSAAAAALGMRVVAGHLDVASGAADRMTKTQRGSALVAEFLGVGCVGRRLLGLALGYAASSARPATAVGVASSSTAGGSRGLQAKGLCQLAAIGPGPHSGDVGHVAGVLSFRPFHRE